MIKSEIEIVDIAIKDINLVGTNLSILGAKNIDIADDTYPKRVMYPSVPKSAFKSERIKFHPELKSASGKPREAYDK